MRQLVTMAASDLRQRLRDKSVVIFALVVPLALMTVLNFIMGGLDDPDPDPVTVAFAAPADDDMADVIGTVLAGLDQPDVSIERHDASQIPSLVEADDADLGVIVPEGFGASVRDGAGPDVAVVQGNGDQIAMTVISAGIDATLDEFHAEPSRRLRARNSGWTTSKAPLLPARPVLAGRKLSSTAARQ